MRSLFVLLALLTWGRGYAAQIFLIFGQDCGERIRYTRTVADVPQMDYFSYSLPAGFGVRMILETDAAGATVRSRVPDEAVSCANFSINESQADRINAGEDHLFVLTPTPDGRYRQQPVLMAAVLDEMNGFVRYRSPFSAFRFDRENSVIGVNLDLANEGAEVNFEGQQGSGCQGSYLIRQVKPSTAYPEIAYRIVPELGIVERHLAGDGRFSEGESIVAVEVNGKTLTEYLADNCAKAEPATTFVPLYIEPEAVVMEEEPVAQTVNPETKAVPTTTEDLPGTIHVVAAGETLYAISRRYNISVDEIRRANNLNGNNIRIGQELTIGTRLVAAPPVYPSAPAPDPVVADPYPSVVVPPARVDVPAAESEAVPTRPQIVIPPPAAADVATEPVSAPAPVSKPLRPQEGAVAGGVHVVQSGETFASIARRYGYTVERFKEFNGLSEAPVALVGQRLRISHCDCPESPLDSPQTTPQPTASTYPASSPVVTPARQNPVRSYPSGESAQDTAPPAYGAPQQQGRAYHTVREGESLYGIARQYRMTVEQLRQLNDLAPADVIVPFQKLYVN